MAELVGQLEWPEYDDYEDFDAYLEAERERMDELQEQAEDIDPDDDDITGALVRFPRADGYAIYQVVGQDPLQLVHVPFADGYQIPSAHRRGLREEDIRSRFHFGKSLA